VIEARGYQGNESVKAILIKNSKYSLFPAINFHFSISTYTHDQKFQHERKNAIFNKENEEIKQELTRSMYKKQNCDEKESKRKG